MPRKIINILLLALSALCTSYNHAGFKSVQLKYPRVRMAYGNTWEGLQGKLDKLKISRRSFSVYLRLFKREAELEVWVRDPAHAAWQLLTTYPVCASSGGPGPKRCQGDGQVPEGFYNISGFNPSSSYHLSLRVSYPNRSDLRKASGDPGGDIMIHGHCVTIGCVPIQNAPIEELYVLCVEAKDRGLDIPAHFFPKRFVGGAPIDDPDNKSLWTSLKEAQTYFDLNRILPNIAINAQGDYLLSPAQP